MSNRIKQAIACLSAVFAIAAVSGRAAAEDNWVDPNVQRQTSWLFATHPTEAQILKDEAFEEGMQPQFKIGDLGVNFISRPVSDQETGTVFSVKFTFK